MHKKLVHCSICVALAIILSRVKLFVSPYGGSVTACSMLFITLAGYKYGAAAGITTGLVVGFFKLMFEGYFVHPLQILLDYPIAFGVLGISGFFRNKKHGLYTGYIVACVARVFCSFLSGILFFKEYAPQSFGSALYIYSLVYNLSYILPEMILTMTVVSIPSFKKAILTV